MNNTSENGYINEYEPKRSMARKRMIYDSILMFLIFVGIVFISNKQETLGAIALLIAFIFALNRREIYKLL